MEDIFFMSRKPKKAYLNDSTVINFNRYPQEKKRPIVLLPRNLNQENYIDLLLNENNTIVFATGPAGTGKTMLAVLAAIKDMRNGVIDKIVITRPAVGVDDEKHGFLPGDINQKMEPWTKPIFDVFEEHYSVKEIAAMLEEKTIEISPLAFMRGRTFKNCWVIADECQNATPNQLKMLLTRIGENSRMVVTGDINQTDRKIHENGLIDFKKLFSKFEHSKHIAMCNFGTGDIERHPAVQEVLAIYGEI